MKNLINLYSILIVVFLSILCMSKIKAQNEQLRKDVSLIAERDLKVFLEKIPLGMETNYGFSKRKEFEKSTLGKPMSILLPSENFYNSTFIDSIDANYEISSIWEVPILVNGNICCLLRMKVINNSCSVIGIGGSLSAAGINKIFKSIGLDKMNNISLLKFPEIKCQYLVVYENSLTNSKCYKIGETGESGLLKEKSLLTVFVKSKQSINKRKDFDYER